MKRTRPYIAFFLLVVYILSMTSMAAPSFSYADIVIKKECPNKADKTTYRAIKNIEGTSGTAPVVSGIDQYSYGATFILKVCTSSNPYPYIVEEHNIFTGSFSSTFSPRPYFYHAPDLTQVLDPPVSA